MAITKSIVKMNHIEALVKVVNDTDNPASLTIDLSVDLLKSNEELSGQPIVVNLAAIESTIQVSGEINITRNNITTCNLFENTPGIEFPWGADTSNNTSDIVVNFTKKGTIYIRMLKVSGFRPLFRPEQGVNLI